MFSVWKVKTFCDCLANYWLYSVLNWRLNCNKQYNPPIDHPTFNLHTLRNTPSHKFKCIGSEVIISYRTNEQWLLPLLSPPNHWSMLAMPELQTRSGLEAFSPSSAAASNLCLTLWQTAFHQWLRSRRYPPLHLSEHKNERWRMTTNQPRAEWQSQKSKLLLNLSHEHVNKATWTFHNRLSFFSNAKKLIHPRSARPSRARPILDLHHYREPFPMPSAIILFVLLHSSSYYRK